MLTQGPALEQGTAGAVITQSCLWPVPEQPLCLSLGTTSTGASCGPTEPGPWATFGMGNYMLGVRSLLALLLLIFLHPFYNLKIIPKFPDSLRASLHSDFILQSSLG